MKYDCSTDCGMLCIWDYNKFMHINDYESWDAELCEDEDILHQISLNKLVPLNLGDGAFQVEVRLNSPNLTSRESEYLLVPSQPYKIITDGTICLSGIEHIEKELGSLAFSINIDSGEYIVQINLIDWNQEPGATESDGAPTRDALPDMIAFIYKDESQLKFRTEIETFRKEDAQR